MRAASILVSTLVPGNDRHPDAKYTVGLRNDLARKVQVEGRQATVEGRDLRINI
jgi:hypothetical protein